MEYYSITCFRIIRVWVVISLAITVGLGQPSDAAAQAKSGLPERPAVTAFRISNAITIDGNLDEPAWQRAQVASGFTQFEPDEGAEPTFPTEIRILYDNQQIYIGALLHDPQPGRIADLFSRRDEIDQVDYFWVSIDSRLNRKTAYTFAVSAAGVQADGIITNRHRMRRGPNAEGPFDTSWDGVWDSAVRVTPEGWVAEIAIPYAMLRFPKQSSQIWGLNFHRNIQRLSEIAEWTHIPRSVSDYVTHYGLLRGIEEIQPRRNLQTIPYTLSKKVTGLNPETATFDIGSDFKIGLTSGTTLDATVNPDFGQVESDPAVLNLTTFETIYPEKRPFFLEGVDIFDFELPGRDGKTLYTRRIGGEISPIIGALKLTGHTENDYAFGFLGAATGREFTPGRYYMAGRLRRDFSGTSHIGGMLTGYSNGPSNDLSKRSMTGGADWRFRFDDEVYEFQGFGIFSQNRSQEPAINDAWQSETGYGGSLAFGKEVGNITYNSRAIIYTDNLDLNDVGQIRQNDLIETQIGGHILLNNNQPFGPFRRAEVFGFLSNLWAYSTGLNRGFGGIIFTTWELKSYQSISIGLDPDDIGGYDIRETRGLGPYKNPGELELRLGFDSDSRKRYQLSPRFRLGTTGIGGTKMEGQLEGRWDLSSRIRLGGEIEHGRNSNIEAWMANEPIRRQDGTWSIGPSNVEPAEVDPSQYRAFQGAGELDDIMDTAADGVYYVPVFGRRNTREFNFEFRGEVALNPNLSLQLFSQLFVARGQYTDPGVLTTPDQIQAFPSYPKRQDFSLHSYILNAVIRWEYQPGSTLYLVWSQSRRSDHNSPLLDPDVPSPYDVTLQDQVADTFGIYPTNVFMLKIDYTLLW